MPLQFTATRVVVAQVAGSSAHQGRTCFVVSEKNTFLHVKDIEEEAIKLSRHVHQPG